MYYYTRFGSYNFLTRTGNPVDGIGSGRSFPSVTRTADAWFDYRLDTRAPLDLKTITARKLVYASECATSAADVYRDLLAKRGKRDRLFRTWKDTPFQQEWAWARLEDFDAVEAVHASDSRLFALSDLVFTQLTPYWYGQGWGDVDYTLIPWYEGQELTTSAAAGQVTFTLGALGTTVHTNVANRGNRDVLAVEVDLISTHMVATDYTIRVRNITDADRIHGWIYDATTATGRPIDAGEFVTVHGGKRTVIEKAAGPTFNNVFSEFLRTGINEQWLTLYPGKNSIEITLAGAGSVDLEVALNYFDAWD